MSDRMAAEIWVGGTLPRSLLNEFPISDLRLDWDENQGSSAEYGSRTARAVIGPTEAPADKAAEWRSTRSSRRR